jgi:uncharacterized protein (TIGR03066 family)
MRKMMAAFVAVVFVLSTTSADDKIDGKKIVGVWKAGKTSGGVPEGATVEFTKDNKLILKIGDIELKGTYKVDGDKLSVKLKTPDDKEIEETDTIKTLTDKKLVLVDKEKKEDEFDRVEPKK